MAKEVKQEKKKVYVETTVVSDATALPARDIVQLSWDFKHITNGHTIPLVERICRNEGYACPCICTPQMLQEGGRE